MSAPRAFNMYLKKKKKSNLYFSKNGLFDGALNLAMIYLVKADRELGISNKMILIAFIVETKRTI